VGAGLEGWFRKSLALWKKPTKRSKKLFKRSQGPRQGSPQARVFLGPELKEKGVHEGNKWVGEAKLGDGYCFSIKNPE